MNVGSRGQGKKEEVGHDDAGGSTAGHGLRRSEDTERFLEEMRNLEDGSDPKAAPPERDGRKGAANSVPNQKVTQIVTKDTRGMDFFDQLDAMEGGYFRPM